MSDPTIGSTLKAKEASGLLTTVKWGHLATLVAIASPASCVRFGRLVGFGDLHPDREVVGVAVLVDGFVHAAERLRTLYICR